ncbi:MAG: class I SAM-dependent methyltransferase [Anaerolineales bacterium]|nr:class I SAM-dependent methyltransferase [Anaerolineales bacterium]
MKLSSVEFRAMQSSWRRWGQRMVELPLFRYLGLDVKGKDVLEVGCGSGYGAFLLHRLGPRSYLGIDLMPEQIELARQKYPDYRFEVRDATNLSHLADASFDVVVIFGVLHHILDWRSALNEISRLLRPGGRLFLEEPRGVDLRLFDAVFRWEHPQSDFGLRAMESHLHLLGLEIWRRLWTPLLTMYHVHKR